MEDTEPTPIILHPTHTAAYAWLGGGFCQGFNDIYNT